MMTSRTRGWWQVPNLPLRLVSLFIPCQVILWKVSLLHALVSHSIVPPIRENNGLSLLWSSRSLRNPVETGLALRLRAKSTVNHLHLGRRTVDGSKAETTTQVTSHRLGRKSANVKDRKYQSKSRARLHRRYLGYLRAKTHKRYLSYLRLLRRRRFRKLSSKQPRNTNVVAQAGSLTGSGTVKSSVSTYSARPAPPVRVRGNHVETKRKSIGKLKVEIPDAWWRRQTWSVKASTPVLVGVLASASPLVASFLVSAIVWIGGRSESDGTRTKEEVGMLLPKERAMKEKWKQVTRISVEVFVLWCFHALPHGLGISRQLSGNFGCGKASDLVGAVVHLSGQGVFVRLVGVMGRLLGVNVLEANAILLGLSFLGNNFGGSRLRYQFADGGQVNAFQLRGFFCRTRGVFGRKAILSFPFDMADTLLSLQGILTATERELLCPNNPLALAFREFASSAANTLDAHSLGALGARNLMGMGVIQSHVRMLGRPAMSLGWTGGAKNICMVGDPICGSLFQKILDPTCTILAGHGHKFDTYIEKLTC